MGLSSVAAIALSSLKEQANSLAATAHNIANSDSAEYQPFGDDMSALEPGSGVDLATEMLDLTEGEYAYKASAAAFETGADLWAILSVVTRD